MSWSRTALETSTGETFHQFSREHGRTMSSAGASEADRQIALALALIQRNQKLEQLPHLFDEARRSGCAITYSWTRGSVPAERAQFGDKKRIRDEAHVEHHVHPYRMAILIAERN